MLEFVDPSIGLEQFDMTFSTTSYVLKVGVMINIQQISRKIAAA